MAAVAVSTHMAWASHHIPILMLLHLHRNLACMVGQVDRVAEGHTEMSERLRPRGLVSSTACCRISTTCFMASKEARRR